MKEILIKYEIENDILFLNMKIKENGKKIEINKKVEEYAAAFILYKENRTDINKLAYLNV
jgi:hypothetical protein